MLHVKQCISLWSGNQTPISRNKDELHVSEYDIKELGFYATRSTPFLHVPKGYNQITKCKILNSELNVLVANFVVCSYSVERPLKSQ
jgi:hypothetical protein